MNNLVDLINKRKEELNNINIDRTDVDYLNNFKTDIKFLAQTDFFELMTLFYMVEKETTLENALKEIENIHDILENVFMQSEDDEFILGLLDAFHEIVNTYSDIKEINLEEFLKIKNNKEDVVSIIKRLLKELKKHYSKEKIDAFLKWMCIDELSDIIALAINLNGVKEELINISKELEDFEIPDFFSERDSKKFQNQCISKINGSYLKKMNKEFKYELNKLSNYQSKKNNEINTYQKKINREIKDLNNLEKDYLNHTLNIDNIDKTHTLDSIKYAAIIELIKNENEKYISTYKKLKEYQNNPINQLEIVFNECGRDFNKLTQTDQTFLVNRLNIDEIREHLNFVTTSSLNFIEEIDECFVNILIQNIDDLMQLDSLIIRNKVSGQFILKYGKEFNSLIIKQLCHNVSKLDSKKVDFSKLGEYDMNILFNLNVKLFDLLVKYGINLSEDNIKHYEFLENTKLINIIDQFIEMGLLEQIQNTPNLIKTNSDKVVKRINLLERMGNSFLNENMTIKQNARSGKDFCLGDDLLDEYMFVNWEKYLSNDIIDILESSDNLEVLETLPDEISFIENYKKNEQVYMIGGLYFSRLKVKRCLNTLINYGYTNYKEILFQVLIYNYPKYLDYSVIEELQNMDKDIIRKQLVY